MLSTRMANLFNRFCAIVLPTGNLCREGFARNSIEGVDYRKEYLEAVSAYRERVKRRRIRFAEIGGMESIVGDRRASRRVYGEGNGYHHYCVAKSPDCYAARRITANVLSTNTTGPPKKRSVKNEKSSALMPCNDFYLLA